jgi:hypothetical protein
LAATATPRKLPTTGANILLLVVVAGALLYAGIELTGVKWRMDDRPPEP